MTTRPRILATPRLDAQAMAVGRTTRAGHAAALADLADDAAGGRYAQRCGFGRVSNDTGVAVVRTIRTLVRPSPDVRYLRAWLVVGPTGKAVAGGTSSIRLAITSASTGATVPATDLRIPPVFRSDTCMPRGMGRVTHAVAARGWLDVAALCAGAPALVAHDEWLCTWTCTLAAYTAVEACGAEEVPRFLVDTTEPYGCDLGQHLPRAPILDEPLQRVLDGTEAAYDRGGAYLCLGWDDADPAVPQTTAAAYAALTNLEESAGVPIAWRVRVRRSDGRVELAVRYQTSGAGAGKIRVHASTGDHTFDLPATGGAWAWLGGLSFYIATTGEDTITLEAQVAGGGTISFSAFTLRDLPE